MKQNQAPKETPVPVKIANAKEGTTQPKNGVKIRGTGAATKGLKANGPMA